MRNPLRALAAAAVTAGLVLVAGPALAHVTVNPHEAEQGSYSKLTFRVPTESDTLSTTELTVQLPTDQPFQSVSVKPHPGWTYAVQKSGDAVSTITWTADKGSAIKPGEFDEFDISVGPLPDVDSVAFKALQTYSDGSVVRWIEETKAGQAEPEHPAPVLTLTPASDETASTDTTTSDTSGSGDTSATAAQDDDGDSKAPLVISIVALVIAVAGAGLALVRRRA
jgi:periplasmic copper chaperone A